MKNNQSRLPLWKHLGMEIKEFKVQVLSSKNKLFRFAFRLLQNHEEAEDTVQDVFLKLWDMRHKLDQ